MKDSQEALADTEDAQAPRLEAKRFIEKAVSGSNRPLPPLQGKTGPITAKKLRTVLWVYGSAYSLAVLLLLTNISPRLNGFALGLMWPGGSFFYGHHYFAGTVVMAFFIVSVTANRYMLPAIWLGGAVLGTVFINAETCPHSLASLPLLSLGLVLLTKWASNRGFQKDVAATAAVNQVLQQHKPLTVRSAPGLLGRELTEEDLAHSKFILDRALQPIDEFNGLSELEPFGTSALRYQLNYAQYALALYNYCHTPAFSGYLHAAQRRLIEKMTHRKAWGYWRVENIWGNLDRNPDPIRRDNIMFSAYLGQMLGMYQTVSGDTRYSQANALTFCCPGGDVHYDLNSINTAILRNFKDSEFCLYPCEPNWSYTMCNPFGLNSLLLNDRLNGRNDLTQIEAAYRHNLRQEFTYANGRFIPLRSMIWGFNLPRTSLAVNDGLAAYLHHPSLPDFAETSWEMMRYQNFTPQEKYPFQLPKIGRVDIGNYRRSRIGPYAAILMAAREMGDNEVFDAVYNSIEQKAIKHVEEEELIYRNTSNFTHFMLAVAKFGRPAAFHDLLRIGMPKVWQQGPMLAQVPYPQVLVYRAVSDGQALELGLQAQHPQPGMHTCFLTLERLLPNRKYRIQGTHQEENLFTASTNGSAQLQLKLHGRHSLLISPVH